MTQAHLRSSRGAAHRHEGAAAAAAAQRLVQRPRGPRGDPLLPDGAQDAGDDLVGPPQRGGAPACRRRPIWRRPRCRWTAPA